MGITNNQYIQPGGQKLVKINKNGLSGTK